MISRVHGDGAEEQRRGGAVYRTSTAPHSLLKDLIGSIFLQITYYQSKILLKSYLRSYLIRFLYNGTGLNIRSYFSNEQFVW